MSEQYLWVIGGGVLQIPLIKEANKLGLKTIVSDLNKECVAKEYANVFAHIDIFDMDGHIEYLKKSDLNIIGVLAAGIDAPETMASMNEYLGIKGVSLETALLVKNKDQFRVKLKELGYDVPSFEIITKDNVFNINTLLSHIPTPLIVKPTNNSGSRDMKIFHEKNEGLNQFILNNLEKYDVLLVEEMWYGEEQTVECLVDSEGIFHEGFITDRKFDFTNDFPIETGLIHPTQLNKEKQETLYALAKKVASDLNINVGAVKLDTIYTSKGPRIIELTVRHSGGFDCQFLVPLSTGKNVLKAAILSAIGKEFDPQLLSSKYKKFGVTGSIWPEPGLITSIEGIKEAKQIKGVEEIFLRYNINDKIEPYINCASRVIFIICTADSLEQAQEYLKQAQDVIKIKTE